MSETLPPEIVALKKFWQNVRENIFDGIEGCDAQEWALDAGLLVEVRYNPAEHGEIDEAEEGDLVYIDSPLALALKAKP